MKRGVLLIVLGLFTQILSPQKVLNFDSFSIEDGFSSSKANVIIQDSKGFIWVGTWNGLTRFDGYNTRTYSSGIEDRGVISNREVTALLEDKDGNIWIGTSLGLNKLNPINDEIEIYDFNSRILALYQDQKGLIWVGTWSEGLVCLNPENGNKRFFIEDIVISDIIEDNDLELWVATYQGLVNLDRETGTYTLYSPNALSPEKSVPHHVVSHLALDDEGFLWVATWGGGVSKMFKDSTNKEEISFKHFKKHTGSGSINSNEIYKLFYDNNGNLWIGTWDAGINLLIKSEQSKEPEEAFFHSFEYEANDPYSLSGNNVTALYVDRSGVLWVGSRLIDRTNILKGRSISRYIITHSEKERNYESSVRAIEENSEGELYIGTSRDLKKYIKNEDNYNSSGEKSDLYYWYEDEYFESNSVLSLLCYDRGLLIGTDDAGLLVIPKDEMVNFPSSSFDFYNNHTPIQLPGNKISVLHKSSKYDEIVWLGSMQHGFSKLSFKDHKIQEIKNYNSGNTELSDNNIRDIFEDQNGFVWIATQRGVNRFDPETEDFLNFFSVRNDSTTINDNIVNCFSEDSHGNLWVSTNSGLNKKIVTVHPNGSETISFKRFPNLSHIGSGLITNMVLDSDNSLWLSFYEGIAKFDPEKEQLSNSFLMREFQRIGIERNTAHKSLDGQILLGGTHGFISLYPKEILFNTKAPEIIFTDIQIFNKSIADTPTDSDKDYRSVPYLNSLVLTPSERVVTFEFSAMDFTYPALNSYAYMLEGFDTDWNMVGERNTATYTNVPDGKYTFKVKAANSDGVWSELPATLSVTILPPWWKTLWAFIIYVIVIIALLYFFKRYSIIQVKEKSKLLFEKIQHEKEHELNDLKVRFFTNITHEFRTPLTLVLSPVDEILAQNDLPDKYKKPLHLVKRNAERLLRLINQLMDFRKVDRGKMELFLQKFDIVPVLKELFDSFQALVHSKNIELSMDISASKIEVWMDRDKFEKIFLNLLSNALKFSDNGGKVSVKAGIKYHDVFQADMFFIDITDDGIGIALDKQELIFDRFYQIDDKKNKSTGGIGLYLARIFVEQHQGIITVESEPGQGSSFRVMLPLSPIGTTEGINSEQEKEGLESSYSVQLNGHKEQEQEQKEKEESVFKVQTAKEIPSVVIVEDDEDLKNFIVDGLSDHFNVISSSNGKEALDDIRKHDPDIVVTDVMMPEMNGFELCRILREDISTSHIPVVIITAKTMQEDEQKGLELGAVDYIYKPFNMANLKLKLLNIMKNKQKNHERFRKDLILKPEVTVLSSLDDEFLKNAVAAVEENLDNSAFDVESLSDKLKITPNQTYRKIKALTGFTAKEFIRTHRLKTAAQLLVQKKRNISEIIYMVGFSSPSYFSRCFKDYFGCTPTEYIERETGEANS